ncbi:DUF551 domain-containing protein [Citrobacter sedlakii]|uniref:DUF551 domain-containing protein n=1 Tax=Citrobacter sedlakii TaxID=67826 RepID=UPI00333DC496
MSTITKEWLQSQISAIKAVGITESNTLQAFEIALASLEAEPVAWRSLYYENHGLLTGSKNVLASWQKQGWECEPLYTSPPAPVSVPDEITREDYKRRFMEEDNFDDTFRGGWNACRAAMLQGAEPVSNLDELPDGWVACSERMPPPKTGVIVGCWFGRNWATKWATYLPYHPDAHQSGFLMPGGSWTPTHWMPLPAAPKQEVR